MQSGLYVAFTPDGKIKRHLSTRKGEMPLDETTIADELIQFSEKEILFKIENPEWVWNKLQQIDQDPTIYEVCQDYFKLYISLMSHRDPIHGILTQTKIEDEVPWQSCDATSPRGIVIQTLVSMSAVGRTQVLVKYVLNKLCHGKPIPAGIRSNNLQNVYVTTVSMWGDPLETRYLFRSEDTYYEFLLQRFLASKPFVARCKYCGRVFIPKTRKKAKYCDRIVRNGKTCKQIAPYLNRKERASTDHVISEFKRVNDMLLHRLERSLYDKKPSAIDLTQEEYYKWLDMATNARDRYLIGELSEEEALPKIHVPTIQELREKSAI